MQKGNSDSAFIVGIVALLVLSWIGGSILPERESGSRGPSFVSPSSSSRNNTDSAEEIDPIKSPFFEQVKISTGNARSAYQPSLEYITLKVSNSRNQQPINITGWTLQNGAGSRRYQLGNSVILGNSSRIPIPQGSKLFIPNVANTLGPVILNKGERAHIVTGNMAPSTRYPINSFQVNKCSGYLEKPKEVKFSPSISLSCPSPTSYPQVEFLEKSCYDFVRKIPRCHTPEFKDVRRPDGGYEVGGVDGVFGLTNQCKAFIQTTFNYNSCVANHINDEDFYKGEWRIFLGQPWELWAKERETITLYDREGKIVHQIKY